MRTRYRPSALCCAAALSAVAFVSVIVGWVRSYPHTGVTGWHTVRESSPTIFVLDSYTVQACRGQVWFGRCRFSLVAPPGFKDGGVQRIEQVAQNLSVFEFDGEPSPVKGFGWVSAEVARTLDLGSSITYVVDEVVLPNWFLALVTGLLPTVWIGSRVWRPRRTDTAADDGPSW